MKIKICSKCKKEKELSKFYKKSSTKDGHKPECIACVKKYLDKNKERIKVKRADYYLKNKPHLTLQHQKYRDNHKPQARKYYKKYKEKYPWKITLKNIKYRCTNPKDINYKNYGGRGIKCEITEDELKFLWFRDKAYDLDRPSIDRKENNGHYKLSNCRYIELRDNIAERNVRNPKPRKTLND
jgi:hypothetical protein